MATPQGNVETPSKQKNDIAVVSAAVFSLFNYNDITTEGPRGCA